MFKAISEATNLELNEFEFSILFLIYGPHPAFILIIEIVHPF